MTGQRNAPPALPIYRAPRVPLSKQRPKQNAQTRVDRELHDAVREEMGKEGRSFRDLFEWALKCYLYMRAPQMAARMGIDGEN